MLMNSNNNTFSFSGYFYIELFEADPSMCTIFTECYNICKIGYASEDIRFSKCQVLFLISETFSAHCWLRVRDDMNVVAANTGSSPSSLWCKVLLGLFSHFQFYFYVNNYKPIILILKLVLKFSVGSIIAYSH